MRERAWFFLLLLAILFSLSKAALAQRCWGQASPAVAGYYWRPHARNADQLDLLKKGFYDFHAGAYFRSEGKYYPRLGEGWGKAMAPPIAVPAAWAVAKPERVAAKDETVVAAPIEQNFGIDLDMYEKCRKRQAEGHFLTLGGETVQITKEQAAEFAEKGLPDDRDKPWLVAVGSEAQTKRVREDFYKDLELSAKYRLWAGPPDHFHLLDSDNKAPLGYRSKVDPTLHLVQADGKVTAIQEGYDGPKDLEAIRRPKPFDPDKVPDPRKPEPRKPDPDKPAPLVTPDMLAKVPTSVWVLAGLLAIVLGMRVMRK